VTKWAELLPLPKQLDLAPHTYFVTEKPFQYFWNRAQAQLPTTWTLKDGTAAHFATGQIWIALTDSEPKFTQSASPAPTK
jgi:hypothetical protein